MPGWSVVDNSDCRFMIKPIDEEKARFIKTYSTLSEMFLSIFNEEVLKLIWDHYPPEHWVYSKCGCRFATINQGKFDFSLIIKYMAVYIRIMGLQNAPKENRCNKNALRSAVHEAVGYFIERMEIVKGTLLLPYLSQSPSFMCQLSYWSAFASNWRIN